MPLPKDLLDQLLTGYLDDALSKDERARVEQLVHTDERVAEDLAQLRELRSSLRAVAHADSDIRLDSGFADRVLGEAVARARTEGLADDHPLIRLEEQPSTTPAVVTSTSSWRMAGVMVGLAASIVIAVVLLRPDSTGEMASVPVAEMPVAGADSKVTPPQSPGTVPQSPGTVPESLQELKPVTPEMVASSTPDTATPDTATRGVNVDTPNVDVAAVEPKVTPEPVVATESNEPTLEPDKIAMAGRSSGKPESTPEIDNADLPATGRGAVLVWAVSRTEAGRESDAVGEAMRLANISPAVEKKITEQVASFVEQTERVQGADVTVLYLQAPAKNLDRFYLRLLADRVGIESVGMTIVENAPISKVLRTLRPDPTAVRHENESLELLAEDGAVSQLAAPLAKLNFIPMRREATGGTGETGGSGSFLTASGPDEPAQVLVLIR